MIRVSLKNYERLKIARGSLSLTKKLEDILNLYFTYDGGIKEIKKMEKNINDFKSIL